MPALVNYGDDDFYNAGPVISMDSSRLFSTDVYFPPSKRARVASPFPLSTEERKPSLDSLPDECLFEIFRRLANGQPKSASACVSKRWLMLLSSVRNAEIQMSKKDELLNDVESDGYLSRCVEGKKANDVRLAALAIGTSSRGGLGKITIRGSKASKVTDLGLTAVARWCPSLRGLSLWNVPSIGDEGLCEVAKECHLLENLDLSQCPLISDKGLIAIAQNSPNLSSIMIESCPKIGNESLQAIAKWCPKLHSLTIKDSSLVGDQGVACLLSSPVSILSKLILQNLRLSDFALAVIGRHGKALTCLTLSRLQLVSVKGFWAMGNASGLNKLSSLRITSCRGVTDLSLEAIGKGCPILKQMCLRKCCFVSDNGLVAFARAALSLESLHLEECNRITQVGLLGSLSGSNSKLKSLALIKCLGIKDLDLEIPFISANEYLQCLSIRNCPGFGSASLAIVGKLCPQLKNIHFAGLCGITDNGLLPLVESCDGLVKVNLSGCYNLTDEVVSAIARVHGGTIEVLNLDGCVKVTDASLYALAFHCLVLEELDVSKCLITDLGIAALSSEEQINLLILSLSGCSKVSNKSVSSLRKLGKSLVGLNLQFCNSMSSSAVDKLVESLWRCDIIS